MRMLAWLVCGMLGAGCAKTGTVDSSGTFVRGEPAALDTRPFLLPSTETHTLSNGMKVVFLENHEVPLFSVQLVLEVGAFLDPEGQEGFLLGGWIFLSAFRHRFRPGTYENMCPIAKDRRS